MTPNHQLVTLQHTTAITLKDLEKLGVTKPFIYPEMEKVPEYLKDALAMAAFSPTRIP